MKINRYLVQFVLHSVFPDLFVEIQENCLVVDQSWKIAQHAQLFVLTDPFGTKVISHPDVAKVAAELVSALAFFKALDAVDQLKELN